MQDWMLAEFAAWLKGQERAAGTIEKYLRDIRAFFRWLDGRTLCDEAAAAWKRSLLDEGYVPCTINSMLAALHSYCSFAKLPVRVRFLKIQRRPFRAPERELTQPEFCKLLTAARQQGTRRLALIIETIAATGIRVSELRYITLDAVYAGRADVQLKGKIRTILLPKKLRERLRAYAKAQKITCGEIFLTAGGVGISRKQIWAELKRLCVRAHVAPEKVFPHNLRHLFAVAFYKASRDIVKLADVLGHTSIETTRLYLTSSGKEHLRLLDRLQLVE